MVEIHVQKNECFLYVYWSYSHQRDQHVDPEELCNNLNDLVFIFPKRVSNVKKKLFCCLIFQKILLALKTTT